MTTEERIKKQKEIVEVMGRYFDEKGFQPIAGRILGLLMVMDKEEFTFEEIVDELQISKSSASNALKNLQIRGDITYITHPGDRKRYFTLNRKDSLTQINEFKKELENFTILLRKIIELKADKNSKNTRFFSEAAKMTEFFLSKADTLLKEYINKKSV